MGDKPNCGDSSRRSYVKTIGALSTLGTTAFAGCTGGGEGNGSGGETTTTSTTTSTETTTSGGNDEPILFGHLAPMTGPGAFAGTNARAGLEVTLDEIQGNPPLGRQIEINRQDTETKPQPGLSGFKTLNAKGVVGIHGPSSFVLPSLIQPIKNAKVPVVTPMATTIQLNDVGGTWIWRTTANDALIGKGAGVYAKNQGINNLGIAYLNSKGNRSLASIIEKEYQNIGGNVVKKVGLAQDADSYRSEVNALASAGADAVILVSLINQGTMFIKNWREIGPDAKLLVSDELTNDDLIKNLGDAANGITGFRLAPGPNYDRFSSMYKELHGKSPGPFTATSYDAMNIMLLAIQRAGEASRTALKDNIRQVSGPPGKKVVSVPEGKKELAAGNEIDYHGAATPVDFDDTGDVVGPVQVVQVKSGEWANVTTYSASELSN